MTRFELKTCGIGSNHSVNWATTTANGIMLLAYYRKQVYPFCAVKQKVVKMISTPSRNCYTIDVILSLQNVFKIYPGYPISTFQMSF